MAYFRNIPQIQEMLKLFNREESWLILINADPDAIASSMALSRIMSHRVKTVEIVRINEIKRPDNLAMIRSLRVHLKKFSLAMLKTFNRFALVDSQPHHSPVFEKIPFSIIIDHHPLPRENAAASAAAHSTPYVEVHPELGACSTILTEYLYNLKIRPGKLLATALQYGIKSDTLGFARLFHDTDLHAYHYLAKFADQPRLIRIARSEFHKRWLPFFAKACLNLHKAGTGRYVYIGNVENPDILVVIADFLTRVEEFRWVAVAGRYGETVVVIYRGDGSRDIGRLAAAHFSGISSAGGHHMLARAEFPASIVGNGNIEEFVAKRIQGHHKPKAARTTVSPNPRANTTAPS
ncbi:DHH family phosphoesterase [Deltaproteobacteria bacterium]|nr:DHH family phosphoesterase [Deltaproteobacteria bacterium]